MLRVTVPDMSGWPEESASFEVTVSVKVGELGDPQNLKDMDTFCEKLLSEFKAIARSYDPLSRVRVEVKKLRGGVVK